MTIGIDLPAQFFKNLQALLHGQPPILAASCLVRSGEGIKRLDGVSGPHESQLPAPPSFGSVW